MAGHLERRSEAGREGGWGSGGGILGCAGSEGDWMEERVT